MSEKPTTFKLAQLAAAANPTNARPEDAVRRAWALWHAADQEITEHENRANFLRSLFRVPKGNDIPIFTDSPEDWAARLKSYPGNKRDVDKAMWNEVFPSVEVQKRLFKDKSLTRQARGKLFLGLARACITFDMAGPKIPHTETIDYLSEGGFTEPREGFPIHPQNVERAWKHDRKMRRRMIPANEVRFVDQVVELLSHPQLYAYLVRWAVEVRQKQLAVARSRVIPASLRRRAKDRDRDANIQVKRPFRQ